MTQSPQFCSAKVLHRTRAVLIVAIGLLFVAKVVLAATKPAGSSELFTTTNVWTVHLKFAAPQWDAMEPKQEGPGMFGPPGGGRPAGPGSGGGRPGGGPPGPGMFGPGQFVAPFMLQQADSDKNGKLSKAEFEGLAKKWFADWDKEKTGRLSVDQLRTGLNTSIAPPGPGGSGPGAGGPGRPGGFGGPGPGMNLQGAEGKRNGLSSAAGLEFQYVHADLEWEGQGLTNVAVRYKGNGTFMQSRGSNKRSLKIQLNKFAKGQRLGGVSTLNLHNNVTDASWMNEVLSHALFRDAGVPAPRTAYARVYVTVPGKYDHEYLGLYSLVEDIDPGFLQERFGTRNGAVFKPVTHDLFSYLGDDWKRYNQTYDPKTTLTTEQKKRVIEFSRLVTEATDEAFSAKLPEYVDLDEFARFMGVTVWLSTLDSILTIGQNYYVYLDPRTQRFQFLPWDLDHSFGQFPMIGSQEQRENLDIHHPWQGNNRFLERVFKTESFKERYLACLREFSDKLFVPDRFVRQVDEIAAAIRPAVKEESADKLARFDKVVAGEAVEPAGFGPGAPRFGGPGGMFPPVKPIKVFVAARAKSVRDQLAGTTKGERVGEFGFGRPGGPRGFGAGTFMADGMMTALDSNKDGALDQREFTTGFSKWFDAWNTDRSGSLSEEQLRNGINQELSPFRGGPERESPR